MVASDRISNKNGQARWKKMSNKTIHKLDNLFD